MATERKNVVDRIKDLTLCCICADTLTDARVLPCLHTFCLQCLQLAGADRRPYQRMPCPICRNEFSVPRQGFSGLQKNFLMENLLEMASLPSPMDTDEQESTAPENDGNSLPCDVCSDVGHVEASATLSVAAVVYCVDCRQSLCKLCFSHHKRMPATRLHQFSDDANVVGEFRREIAGEVETVTAWMAEGEAKKQKVVEEKTKFLEEITSVEEDVRKLRDKAKEIVDLRAASLLQELSTSKRKHLTQFEDSLDHLEGHLAILESFMKRCMHAKDAGTADDVVCRVADDLKGTAEDLHHMHESKLKEQVAPTKVPINVTELDHFLDRRKEENPTNKEETKNKDKVSSIREQQAECSPSIVDDIGYSVTDSSSRPMKTRVGLLILVTSVVLAVLLNGFIPRAVRRVSLHLAARLDEDHSVMGVTAVDDNIYVLSGSLGSVLVYQAQDPFSLIKEIPIPQIKSPWDMVGSSESSCLYVSDKDTSCVWKVTLDKVEKEGWFLSGTYEHLVTRWLCGIREPHTLSISNDGSVLLLLSRSPPLLETYHHDSTLIHILELPLEVEDPRHVLESSSGTYVVSYGWSGTKTQGMVELASDGRLLRTYDPLYEWQKLKNPHHLAMDAEGRIFVAEFYNNRVLLLDSNLNWDQRTVLTEDNNDISKPHRLYLDRRHRNLIIAHSDGARVDVYAVEEIA